MRILFTGGGTGGHLYPIVAVARQLKKISQNENFKLEMYFIGPKEGQLDDLVKENIKVKTIVTGKLRRYFSIDNFFDFFKMPIGFFQSLFNLFFLMPDVILSKGGYGSIPVVIVGWLFHIKIYLHESDTVAGLANRLATPMAKKIAVSFQVSQADFPQKKINLTGNPIRLSLIQANKEDARNLFKLTSSKPVILIFGGSQGAQALNDITLYTLPQLLDHYEIILVCGQKNFEAIKKEKNVWPENFRLFPFLNETQLKNAYAAADLVISRAGSGSIFEIAACGKPSILIPLDQAAGGHQRLNAFEYARFGGAVIIEEENLKPHLFLQEIKRVIEQPELMASMSEAAKSFAQPEAAEKIALDLLELGK